MAMLKVRVPNITGKLTLGEKLHVFKSAFSVWEGVVGGCNWVWKKKVWKKWESRKCCGKVWSGHHRKWSKCKTSLLALLIMRGPTFCIYSLYLQPYEKNQSLPTAFRQLPLTWNIYIITMTSKNISEKEFVWADKIPRYRASIQIRSLCLVSAKSPYRLGLIKIIALVYSKKNSKSDETALHSPLYSSSIN